MQEKRGMETITVTGGREEEQKQMQMSKQEVDLCRYALMAQDDLSPRDANTSKTPMQFYRTCVARNSLHP